MSLVSELVTKNWIVEMALLDRAREQGFDQVRSFCVVAPYDMDRRFILRCFYKDGARWGMNQWGLNESLLREDPRKAILDAYEQCVAPFTPHFADPFGWDANGSPV